MTESPSPARFTFLRDKDGNVVIWQWPNFALWGWIIFKALSLLITQESLKLGFAQLGTAFIFAWAYMEMTSGVNYFRKLLGLIVLLAIVVSFFR
ncbi:MAG: hypothetical protein JWM37_499 [Candidatus Saccharibacteria bacterium]|nr:hypothetical protein [Candidatus Saccharibacteria bacterium]